MRVSSPSTASPAEPCIPARWARVISPSKNCFPWQKKPDMKVSVLRSITVWTISGILS